MALSSYVLATSVRCSHSLCCQYWHSRILLRMPYALSGSVIASAMDLFYRPTLSLRRVWCEVTRCATMFGIDASDLWCAYKQCRAFTWPGLCSGE
eukprot:228846-Rhodomonas_salina.2